MKLQHSNKMKRELIPILFKQKADNAPAPPVSTEVYPIGTTLEETHTTGA